MYAGAVYRQHNPLIEDGIEGLRKFVARLMANHPDARGEIKRVFADGDCGPALCCKPNVTMEMIGLALPLRRCCHASH